MNVSSLLKIRIILLLVLAGSAGPRLPAQTAATPSAEVKDIHVAAAGFAMGSANLIEDVPANPYPFNQAAVKQGTDVAKLGPDPKVPYFTVRFALPVPPSTSRSGEIQLTGMDPGVFEHNHSPGFEILPNGDSLAIYFSTPRGESESANTTTFIQARLRYGAEEWDMPELFMDFKGINDQSGLMWKDGSKVWFFGGGRGDDLRLPFKIATTTDNGMTWALSLPKLDEPAKDFTAQPITSAFRAADGAIYFAMDGAKSQSFLWRSKDDGVHWQQMEGRTSARHSPIVPLDDKGNLLSFGGKNTSINGWAPVSYSKDWGATWTKGVASPFPALNSGQRPSMIRLADGNLLFVSDDYNLKARQPPPDGWTYGQGCFVAISKDNGANWAFKRLPVEVPSEDGGQFGTLGYVTARQAPNGVIHVLSTKTLPCLEYEFNEAWISSNAGDIAPETTGGTVKQYSEKYANGKVRAEWSARICPNGRYLLDGMETDYYENGHKEHEVTYASGRKTGEETFWSPEGTKLWSWTHDLKNNTAVWAHYWSNGLKRNESSWDARPLARDLPRNFVGYAANGPVYQWKEDGSPEFAYNFTEGFYTSDLPLPKAQAK